jgi:hypothetical protein
MSGKSPLPLTLRQRLDELEKRVRQLEVEEEMRQLQEQYGKDEHGIEKR